MARSVGPWVGKTADSTVPERVLERLWKACNGKCQGCGLDLSDQAWDADHIVALVNWIGEGHGNQETNLQVLGLKCCHRPKTKQDMKIKWSTSRKVRHHAGIKRTRNPVPGSKASKYKIKLDGTVIDRATGEVISRRRA